MRTCGTRFAISAAIRQVTSVIGRTISYLPRRSSAVTASAYFPGAVSGDGYSMAKAYKDMVSAAEIGSSRCIPMPVLGAAAATYQMALLRGHGESDKGGMIRVFEELLGVRYRHA